MSAFQFLTLQGSGGTAVPYNRRNGPYNLNNLASNPLDSLRLRRYEEHWRFYQGLHWSFQREDGEPLVSVNYCRTVVEKKVSWLVGKGMTITVPEVLTNVTKPILEEVWRYNGQQAVLNSMATTGGVTGDVFILVLYEEPTDVERGINPHTKGKIRIRLVQPHQVFPIWDPLNVEKLQAVRIVTEVAYNGQLDADNPQGIRRDPTPPGAVGALQKRRYIEDISANWIVEGWEGEQKSKRKNDLGEIPLVHIANIEFPGEYYGLSDLDGVIDIQRELNEKMTDVSDIINYHAAPVTIMTGSKARNLEKGPKALWAGLPAEAKVYNLELGGDLGASHRYIELIRQMLMDIANLPEGSLGRIQPISNTAAAALQVAFQPLVECTERKTPNYTRGVQKVNYFILRTHQLVTKKALPVDLCRHCGGRILEIEEETITGEKVPKLKCFLIDHQTLELLPPGKVEMTWKRKHSFGVETRSIPFDQIKKEFKTEGASAWDVAPPQDLEQKAQDDQDRNRELQEWQNGEEHEQNKAAQPPPEEPAEGGEEGGGEPPASTLEPRKPKLPPKELDKPVEVKPEQLAPNEIDVPDEPETHDVTLSEWDPIKRTFVYRALGELKIVPTGCKRPDYLNPYENEVSFKSALPRDLQNDTNLYSAWQTNGWMDRHQIMKKLDQGIPIEATDKALADDIPFLMQLQGKAPAPGVAQTAGVQGDSNGAPPPPGPGPGRGNMVAPGDNLASAPPNGSPGSAV